MIFHLAAVGRLRSTDLRAACDDYTKRIRRYAKLQIHEVPERLTLDAEGDKLVSVLKDIPVRILLTRVGKGFSSREFAAFLDKCQLNARDTAFVVGGAHGVHQSVAEMCDDRLQLSRMTLPHDMARVVLLEQIYRGFTILKGEPYHKGD